MWKIFQEAHLGVGKLRPRVHRRPGPFKLLNPSLRYVIKSYPSIKNPLTASTHLYSCIYGLYFKFLTLQKIIIRSNFTHRTLDSRSNDNSGLGPPCLTTILSDNRCMQVQSVCRHSGRVSGVGGEAGGPGVRAHLKARPLPLGGV